VCESLRPYEHLVKVNLRDAKAVEAAKADPKWEQYQKFLADNPAADAAVRSNAASVYFEAKRRNPAATFADAFYVYKKAPWVDQSFAGDVLQLGFDMLDGYHFRMKLDTDRVPYGFHAMPDTDYEFSAYACQDGGSELWRVLAPGMPRGHYYPRQPRAKFDQGPVEGAQLVVARDGSVIIYEMAIPWAAMKDFQPAAGRTFGFTFCARNNKGPHVSYGIEKSATKNNGLALHPYWESKPSCGVRWALVE